MATLRDDEIQTFPTKDDRTYGLIDTDQDDQDADDTDTTDVDADDVDPS